MESLSDSLDKHKFSTKERSKEKNNKARGQFDNLKKYANPSTKSSGESGTLATADKLIKREANYLKNIHIDEAYQKLKLMGLITNRDDQYQAWWCGVMHKLGVAFVMAQADQATKNATTSPAGLFHFLINKAINKLDDPNLPRF